MAPLLVQFERVGTQSAAQLMMTVDDNAERLKLEASFAMLCGIASVPRIVRNDVPVQAEPGGDRQANSAIHIVATGRLRADEHTEEYAVNKMAEGHAKIEAIRA